MIAYTKNYLNNIFLKFFFYPKGTVAMSTRIILQLCYYLIFLGFFTWVT